MAGNPYRLPNKPHVTIRDILVWAAKQSEVTLEDVREEFDITSGDASVRLLKLHRWGYLQRWKNGLPPRVYRYRVSRFGAKTAKKWKGSR
jgi:predicted transcriptional regulator of viral defense system